MKRFSACVLLLLAAAVGAEPLLPGTDLGELVDDPGGKRFGLDGAPPGALGQLPRAPTEPGKHWLVIYDAEGEVLAWRRFEVGGEIDGEIDGKQVRTIEMQVDNAPPQAELRLIGDQHTRDGRQSVGPQSGVEVEASDPSGGVSVALLVDGQAIGAGKRWTADRADGRYRLALQVADALGNRGERGAVEVELDSSPPTLQWQRLDAQPGIAEDIFDGKRARLSVAITDTGAGLRAATLGSRTLPPEQLAAGRTDLDVDADSLDYRLEDAVGNRADGRIALRADTEGPRFVASRNGEPVDLLHAKLYRSDSLQLAAEDSLAGVARACVEASIWYGECRELPVDLVGLAPGRYRLEFRAADRLGNRSIERLTMEVLP
jgi:hypothetical protein